MSYAELTSMMDRLKSITSLSDSAGDPIGKFPNYLSEYRKKYAKNMLGYNPALFSNPSAAGSQYDVNQSALGAGIGASQPSAYKHLPATGNTTPAMQSLRRMWGL